MGPPPGAAELDKRYAPDLVCNGKIIGFACRHRFAEPFGALTAALSYDAKAVFQNATVRQAVGPTASEDFS